VAGAGVLAVDRVAMVLAVGRVPGVVRAAVVGAI